MQFLGGTVGTARMSRSKNRKASPNCYFIIPTKLTILRQFYAYVQHPRFSTTKRPALRPSKSYAPLVTTMEISTDICFVTNKQLIDLVHGRLPHATRIKPRLTNQQLNPPAAISRYTCYAQYGGAATAYLISYTYTSPRDNHRHARALCKRRSFGGEARELREQRNWVQYHPVTIVPLADFAGTLTTRAPPSPQSYTYT